MLFENISNLCKERKISIAKLEQDVGLGNATIRGWATSSPSAKNLKAVADYFGVSMDSLMKPQPPEPNEAYQNQ